MQQIDPAEERDGWRAIVHEMMKLVKKGKVHPCTGTEVLYRAYGP
jgi:hypothetical protein